MDKQELPINNPAERLYVILTRAAESSPESSIADVFCTAMELEPNDDNFIKGFSQLIGLLEIIEEQIQYFKPRKQEGIRASTEEIKRYLFHAMKLHYTNNDSHKNVWQNVPHLNNKNWTTLKSLNGYVDDFESYGISISNAFLYELINDIDIWITEMNESQLDEEIKQFFTHKLMEIKHLLEKYYRHGSSRIKTEIYATMAEIKLYPENLTEDKKEENRNFFTALYEQLLELSKGFDLVNKPMTTIIVADKLSEVLPPMLSQTAEIIVKHLPSG